MRRYLSTLLFPAVLVAGCSGAVESASPAPVVQTPAADTAAAQPVDAGTVVKKLAAGSTRTATPAVPPLKTVLKLSMRQWCGGLAGGHRGPNWQGAGQVTACGSLVMTAP
jgi:hypothetical protein